MKNSKSAANLGLVFIIIFLVLQVSQQNIAMPSWMNIVRLLCLGATLVCLIVYFIMRRNEK